MADDYDELQDGVWDACPSCGHSDWFHPDMAGEPDDIVRCAECNADLGRWGDLRARLFTADAMLAATLAKKP